MVANKLKKVLEKVIGPFQTAFVEGRMISNNYIISHEILHSFKKKRKGKLMALKLDMAKAYVRPGNQRRVSL